MASNDAPDTQIEVIRAVDETWFRVSSKRLPQPVDLKVKIQPGRAKVIGLRIDNGRDVTSSELRLPLSELADSVYGWLTSVTAGADGDLVQLQDEARERGLVLDFSRLDGLLAGVAVPTPADELMLAIVDLVQMQGSGEQLRAELADDELPQRSRGRGAKPPTDADYELFARVFESERRSRARGAQSRTAERLNMDRSTALRWIRVCEQRGLIEPRTESR